MQYNTARAREDARASISREVQTAAATASAATHIHTRSIRSLVNTHTHTRTYVFNVRICAVVRCVLLLLLLLPTDNCNRC